MPERTTLDNGLRVVSETIPHVRSVSLGVWVAAGSRWEVREEAGFSHFLEHLLFKGTETRTARELAEAIDAVGGQLNAYTTKEYTCYYVKLLDEHLAAGLELLADMLLRPRLDPQDLEKERAVIAEEIKLYDDTPDELVHDLFAQCLWPDDPLGRPVLGTLDDVAAVERSRLAAFYRRFYVPQAAVLAAVGNVRHDRLVNEVRRLFGGWSGGWRPAAASAPRAQAGRCVRVKETEQVHLCVGTAGLPLGHPDLYALLCLNNLMGGGASSRLFQEIREERGLAYAIHTFQCAYRDTGLVGVYAGSSPDSAGVVLELILAELECFRREGPGRGELERTKQQLKTDLVLSLESTSARASRLGRHELLIGRTASTDEVLAGIDAVRAEDLVRLAERLFEPEDLAVAAVSPVPDPFGGRLRAAVVAGGGAAARVRRGSRRRRA